MLVGSVVIINYAGHDWLVKIERFDADGIRGPYTWPNSRRGESSFCRQIQTAITWPWSNVSRIHIADEPWPIVNEVKLTNEYTAKIGKDSTQVGCTSFPNSKILEVAEMIKKQQCV